jgi:heme/copper-type cytochrome/quinol oxidase subunit 3
MTLTTEAAVPGAHHEDLDVVGRRQLTGVGLLILADVSFVAALIFSWFYLRGLNTSKAWLTNGAGTAPIWVGWAIAAALVVSAWFFRWGLAGLRNGRQGRLVLGLGVALLITVADAVAQVIQIVSFSFKPDANAYASSLYTLAGANLFHLVLTAFIGLGVWNRSRLGKYTASSHWQVDIVAVWWMWIALAGLAGALTTSFIASPNLG